MVVVCVLLLQGDKGRGDAELFNSLDIKYESCSNKKWAPGLIWTSDGDTPFSRLLGKPPIMVAGMTPSTAKTGFVSAVLDVGYRIVLAASGGDLQRYCPPLQGGGDTDW